MTDSPASPLASPGTVRVVSAAATHVGNIRETNEDSLLAQDPIFLVADGMGGHNAGEVASAIVVEEFSRLTVHDSVTVAQLGDALAEAARRIGSLSGPEQAGAGTTVAVVATMVMDGICYWVVLNLGDSRVYRLSGEIFEQVSVDHSVVQELMDRGELTAEEARVHPYRHMVTRALGAGPDSDPDYWLIPAEQGDRMLVCSDGLTGEVPDDVIERVLRGAADVRTAGDDLIQLALDGGGHDNVSVVLVEATEVIGLDGSLEITAESPATPAEAPDLDEDTLPRAIRRAEGEMR